MNNLDNRITLHSKISKFLTFLSDQELAALLNSAEHKNVKSWGKLSSLDIDGIKVFVKKIPLTNLELQKGLSTANVFDLPLYYHYGIGSAGFGAGRELAAHTMTTNWVLSGECQNFPLMYHWRILRGHPDDLNLENWGGLDKYVDYWDGSKAIRNRIEAINQSTSYVVLFMEYIPYNLHDWLNAQLKIGGIAAENAVAFADENIIKTNSFMNSHGLIHFDAHLENILTDGEHLYFSDFGLALSSSFELTLDEIKFFETHQNYDRASTAFFLLFTIIIYYIGEESWDPQRQEQWLEIYKTQKPHEIPAFMDDITRRYNPILPVLNEFYRNLKEESKLTPYPAEQLANIM